MRKTTMLSLLAISAVSIAIVMDVTSASAESIFTPGIEKKYNPPGKHKLASAGIDHYFGEEGPKDSDKDGVFDDKDECPNTPPNTSVDSKGCPFPQEAKIGDEDGDGVLDNVDKCPGTPKGASVDAKGCWVLNDILFDTGKWNIKPDFSDSLDKVGTVLKNNPAVKVEIQGHTDSVGGEKSNLTLSQKRAQSVVDYLSKHGVEKTRMDAKGYGLSQPVADNANAEGRTQNRRVEIHPMRTFGK